MERLGQQCSGQCYVACLETIRILSREKTGLESMTSDLVLKLLVQHAGLQSYMEQEGENVTIQDGNQNGTT